ncbi:MAG: glycosyltransferase family 9 protein [Gammaproteobacteria bacterium]|jgi:heptosyltransferase II|nr:glycosyltransferase family 9 protein [Gammaproteobacteria bacterium]MBU2178649.1 glycosyltransferase family 9 protein [Gammaproteobacteria bacterium]MBU2278301.1 glycosyltransferase family 9 protein [Gammaproteobacteria bacterium]
MMLKFTAPPTDPTAAILIVMPRFLGDAVTATSAVQMIRAIYPLNPIFLLTWPHVAQLFVDRDFFGCQVIVDGRYAKPKQSLWRVARQLAGYHFSRVYHLRNSFSDALLCSLAGIRDQIGYAKNARTPLLSKAFKLDQNFHYQYRYGNLVNLAHDQIFAKMPQISLNAGKKSFVQSTTPSESSPVKQVVVYFGGRYKLSRHYPFELASQALSLLAASVDCHFVLLGDQQEISENAALADYLQAQGIAVSDVTAKTTVAELADIIHASNLVFSIDSGQMHIAAALKVPYVAVIGFGTSPWSCVEPKVTHGIHLTCNSQVLDLDLQICEISPQQVAAAAKQLLLPVA